MKARLSLILCIGLLIVASHVYAATKTEYKVAFLPKGASHAFWKAMYAGVLHAVEEQKQQGVTVEAIWKSPPKEDDRNSQIEVVENFIGRRVDGIVLCPVDSKALVAPAETAIQGGIPVVVVDSGLESKMPVSYIATNNYQGGVIAARKLGELLKGKGNIILVRYLVGSNSTTLREEGFLDTVKKEFPGFRILSADQYAGPTRDTVYQVSQNLLNRFGNEVDGIFAVNEPSAIGMMMALQDIGKAGGKVKLIGFDSGSVLVEGLEKGDIQGLIVQDPFQMGYLSVKALVEHLQGKAIPKEVETPLVFATRENMKEPAVQKVLNPPMAATP